jgi:hypothetical protein
MVINICKSFALAMIRLSFIESNRRRYKQFAFFTPSQFLFILAGDSMNTLYVFFLLPLIAVQVEANEESKCLSDNVTIYYYSKVSILRHICKKKTLTSDFKSDNLIRGWRFVNGEHQMDKDFAIKINKVLSIAFDYRQNRILFVGDERPDTIWSVNETVGVHFVTSVEGTRFDNIAVDAVTNCLYYADICEFKNKYNFQ